MRALRDPADERRTIEREGHQPSPCPWHRQLSQEWENFGGMPMVHLDASGVRSLLILDQLSVTPENDLTSARLAPVQMPGQPLLSAMCQVRRGLGVVSRRGMPL